MQQALSEAWINDYLGVRERACHVPITNVGWWSEQGTFFRGRVVRFLRVAAKPDDQSTVANVEIDFLRVLSFVPRASRRLRSCVPGSGLDALAFTRNPGDKANL